MNPLSGISLYIVLGLIASLVGLGGVYYVNRIQWQNTFLEQENKIRAMQGDINNLKMSNSSLETANAQRILI